MAFWSENKISLKRNWLFLGEINFYSINNAGQASSYGGIKPFLIHSYDKPKLITNVEDFGGQNSINGQWSYAIKSVGWEQLNIKIYDTFAADEESDSTGNIFGWLASLGYDPSTFSDYAGSFLTGQATSVPEFVNNMSQGNAVSLSITTINHDGVELEKFTYLNPLLSGIDFGNASYADDSLPLITLKFNIASVKHEKIF